MTCPVCGGDRQCHLTSGTMSQIEFLTVDDWKEIYQFMRDIWLPFLHRVIARAAARQGIDFSRWRKSKKEIRALEQAEAGSKV